MTPISISALLEEQAARQPSGEAIVHADGIVTYADLLERITALAGWLVHHGLTPSEPTAISVRGEVDHLVCAMTLLCLGTPQVNLPSYEAGANKQALASKIGVTQIIAEQAEEWMAGLRTFVPPFRGLTSARFPNQSVTDVYRSLPRDATPLYQNTSGSTNIPKTIAIPLQRVLRVADRFSKDPSERRVLRTSSVEFDSSRFHRICALLAGNTCVIAHQLDLGSIHDLCGRAEVTAIHSGTYKLASLMNGQMLAGRTLPSFTRVSTGSSRVSGALRKKIKAGLTANLWVLYATSEIGAISLASPEQHEEFPEGVGFPAPGVTVEIIDPDGAVLHSGETGHARVQKADAPRGYLNDPAASTSFRDGWFYPGDLLSRPEGGPLIFHGRADDVMILNGINILPAAIEDALEGHPDINEAVAYAIKSRIHGEIPAAAVVLSENARNQDPSYFMNYCRQLLGIRAPRQILVVERIPRNSAGKPLRRELAAS